MRTGVGGSTRNSGGSCGSIAARWPAPRGAAAALVGRSSLPKCGPPASGCGLPPSGCRRSPQVPGRRPRDASLRPSDDGLRPRNAGLSHPGAGVVPGMPVFALWMRAFAPSDQPSPPRCRRPPSGCGSSVLDGRGGSPEGKRPLLQGNGWLGPSSRYGGGEERARVSSGLRQARWSRRTALPRARRPGSAKEDPGRLAARLRTPSSPRQATCALKDELE